MTDITKQLAEALELAIQPHGVALLSSPPQDAWIARGVADKARAALAAYRAQQSKQTEGIAELPEPDGYAGRDYYERLATSLLPADKLLPENARFTAKQLQAYGKAKRREALDDARKPLTVDEIRGLVAEAGLDWHNGWAVGEDSVNRYLNLARAIEAAHNIKD